MRNLRRIVTMIGPDGISRISSIAAVTARRETGGGGLIEEAWRTASISSQAFADDQSDSRVPAFAPASGGSSCRIVHIPPDAVRWSDPAAVANVAKTIGADRPRHWIERHPGMHVTQSLDYAILLSGSLTMVMEDGEVELEPYDVVVQQATAHAWKNTGQDTAVLFVVMLGTTQDPAENLEFENG